VRVNAQLINAGTDAHEWAENYDRPVDDLFAIQSEIAKAIAEQLQAKLSPNEKAAIEKPPTTDLAAFDLYTRAKTLLLSTSFTVNFQQMLQQAVDTPRATSAMPMETQLVMRAFRPLRLSSSYRAATWRGDEGMSPETIFTSQSCGRSLSLRKAVCHSCPFVVSLAESRTRERETPTRPSASEN
jgi:hypothetical protein